MRERATRGVAPFCRVLAKHTSSTNVADVSPAPAVPLASNVFAWMLLAARLLAHRQVEPDAVAAAGVHERSVRRQLHVERAADQLTPPPCALPRLFLPVSAADALPVSVTRSRMSPPST